MALKVLSLFDGISGGQVALNRAGIAYDKYYASEIDANAIGITQYNYPDTIQLGDINNWENWDIDFSEIDLVIGGSPCQNLSNSGNGQGLQGSQSSLFFKFVDILNHVKSLNPNVKFLLENVRMKKDWEEQFNQYMGCKPMLINSSLVSAQQRNRFYWTNIPVTELLIDKQIYLKDIVEPEAVKQYVNITNQMYAKKLGTLAYTKAWASVRTLDQKSKTLMCSQGIANSGATNIKYDDQHFYKPTPIESERLQTLPDDYTKYAKFSNDKIKELSYGPRIKAIGNGWTIDIIVYLFGGLK